MCSNSSPSSLRLVQWTIVPMIDQIFHQFILMRLVCARKSDSQLPPMHMRQTTTYLHIALHEEFCGVPRLPEALVGLFSPLTLDHVGIRFGQCR